MIAATRVLLACTLGLILLPSAHAQARKSFDAWTVVCGSGTAGYCTASNRIKSVSGPYRFQLNVTRERPAAAFEVALLTAFQHPKDGTDIVIQVDGNKPVKLSPPQGYRRAGRSNAYVIASDEAEQLLKQMRSGKRVRFRFQDTKGAAVDTGFALNGMSAALGFMDQMQSAPQSRAATTAAPPAATSPATDEPQSPRESQAAPTVPKPSPAATETPSVSAATPVPAGQTATPSASASPPGKPVAATTAPSSTAKELSPAPATPPPAPAKEVTTAPATASAPVTKGRTPTTAAATPLATAPGTTTAPVAQEAAPTPAPPKQPAATAPTASTTARPSPADAAQKPAATSPSQVAVAPAQTPPATEQMRSPAQTQKQASVNVPPSASRKRGAKSVRQFSCRGNEPFWSLLIDGDRARYSSMGDEPIELKGKLSVTGEGPTPIVDWSGKSDWGGTFRAVVTEGRCRDTMSDSEGQTEFEYVAQVSVPGGKVVRGCCNAGLPPATPAAAAAPAATDTTQFPVADLRNRAETDWTRYLFDLLPAIQACIDKTPEPDPYATKAWSMNRGMVGVRTRNAQGGWYECVADANGKSIDRFIQLPPSAPLAPNENRVMFSPPDHSPPGGNCYKHERVMDGMGDFMGWLSTNSCS